MSAWAVIPARFGSTRLPGKPLAQIAGRPMVQHVWERVVASGCFARVLVATDDERIAHAASGFGAEVRLTGPARSGTARVALAVGEGRPELVVNVQGDLPLVSGADLRTLVQAAASQPVTTLAVRGSGRSDLGPEHVRVILGAGGRATDFCRHGACTWMHVGLYAFRPGALREAVWAPQTARTQKTSLEQLAWLDAGLTIEVAEASERPYAVDTPRQLEHVRALVDGSRTGVT